MRRRQAFAVQAVKKPPAPTIETLREAYERAFGKPPHHRMKLDTIRERLKAHGDPQ